MSAAHVRHRVAALRAAPARDLADRPNRMGWATRRLWLGIAVLIALLVVGPLAVAVVAAGCVLVAKSRPLVEARRDVARVAAALPDALELFVLIVHAGLTPRQAVEFLAIRAPHSVRHGFLAVVERLHRGDPLADALRALPDLLGSSTLGLADLIGSADRYGLPLAPVLGQLADQARADRRRAADAAARSLPVKLAFPLVVCTLPSFVLLAIVPAVMAALSSLQDTSW
jgi:tight adherence protein C